MYTELAHLASELQSLIASSVRINTDYIIRVKYIKNSILLLLSLHSDGIVINTTLYTKKSLM